jgi:hypothetical protein
MATRGIVLLNRHVQESCSDVFSHDDGAVLVLRVTLPFDVPILDRPNDVTLISTSELDLNLVTLVCLRILQEQVEAPRMGLHSLLVLQQHIAEAKDLRVVRDPLLDPLLAELWMFLQRYSVQLHVVRCSHAFLLRGQLVGRSR